MEVVGHLLAGDEGSDGDAVLLAHHTFGRSLVHLGGAQESLEWYSCVNKYALVLDKLTVRPQVS